MLVSHGRQVIGCREGANADCRSWSARVCAQSGREDCSNPVVSNRQPLPLQRCGDRSVYFGEAYKLNKSNYFMGTHMGDFPNLGHKLIMT